MDPNITHESISSVNGRKRKAEGEENQDSSSDPTPSDDMLVDSASTQNPYSNAPRQHPWLSRVSPATGNGVWPSGETPPVSPLVELPEELARCQKRPRLEREQPASRPMKRLPKRQRAAGGTPLRPSSCPPSRFWQRSDIRDMGIVPTRDPAPLTDSLYHVTGGPCASDCTHHLLPSPLPPINVCYHFTFILGQL